MTGNLWKRRISFTYLYFVLPNICATRVRLVFLIQARRSSGKLLSLI